MPALVTIILRSQNQDREERCRIRALDPRYYLTIRLIAAVYDRLTLPDDTTRQRAIEQGVQTATRTGLRCCLDRPPSPIRLRPLLK